jgi:hypothetical protein
VSAFASDAASELCLVHWHTVRYEGRCERPHLGGVGTGGGGGTLGGGAGRGRLRCRGLQPGTYTRPLLGLT